MHIYIYMYIMYRHVWVYGHICIDRHVHACVYMPVHIFGRVGGADVYRFITRRIYNL